MRIPILPLLVGITLLLCAQAAAADSPKRLTLLADSFSQDSLSAMRAETRVRGLSLEEMHASSLAPDVVEALAQRPNVLAVLYLTSSLGEDSLWAVTSDGRRSHASVPYDVEARTIAAIAHSLIDDLVHPTNVAVAVAVDVNVDVQVHQRSITPPQNAVVSTPRWLIDVGGIVVSDEIWAAHAGLLRTLQPNLRFGVHGTVAQLPNDGFALAASADVSRIWGTRFRFELGARGLVARVYDNYGAVAIESSSCTRASQRVLAWGLAHSRELAMP